MFAFFRKLSPCVIRMEACASAHYWARELSALGHTVRLMPAAYVKPYAKRGKSDASGRRAPGAFRVRQRTGCSGAFLNEAIRHPSRSSRYTR